jgi:hypothetical protein
MAEIQSTTNSSGTAAQFIEFVMMQAQNASLFLGLIPHPGNDQPEVNLPLARMFIDHLAMIQEKTRGNLSGEETNVLRNALSNLQMAYVQVAQEQGGSSARPGSRMPEPAAAEDSFAAAAEDPFEDPVTEPASAPAPASVPAPSVAATPPPESVEESRESKKRFTKSYGS